VSPQQALLLAAHDSQAVNTIAESISVQGTTSGGSDTIAGTVAEQLRPSLIAAANFTTVSVAYVVPG
jgi:hypothetical protein